MGKRELKKIEHKYVIMCEGEDEKRFLIPYLNSAAVNKHKEFSNDIEVINFGGNEELQSELELLKIMPGYEMVKLLLIIRDAETDAKAAVEQIKSALSHAKLPIPEKPCEWKNDMDGKVCVGFLLFPVFESCAKNGTLEDLCLSILSEPNNQLVLSSIDSFLDLLKNKHNRVLPHKFKTKLHTYFSVTDKYVSFKIGESATAGAFDWNSDPMNKLRDFILQGIALSKENEK